MFLNQEGLFKLDAAVVAIKVIEFVQEYTGAEVDIAVPLHVQGIDSIANMELRQKLQVSLIHLAPT